VVARLFLKAMKRKRGETNRIPFMLWCQIEGRRLGLKPATIVGRVRAGFYTGMKLFRLNARRVFVVKAGRCRKPISARQRALTTPRGKAVHDSQESSRPTPGKYYGWMMNFSGGGMTPRYGGE
jgi:hypothetical protein